MMLADTLLLLAANALYCVGFYLCTRPGMIGEFIDRYAQRLGPFYNPICGCITCMSSLHSWPYLLYFGWQPMYIIYVFALAATGTAIYNKYFAE